MEVKRREKTKRLVPQKNGAQKRWEKVHGSSVVVAAVLLFGSGLIGTSAKKHPQLHQVIWKRGSTSSMEKNTQWPLKLHIANPSCTSTIHACAGLADNRKTEATNPRITSFILTLLLTTQVNK
jgi:hypothetical protein